MVYLVVLIYKKYTLNSLPSILREYEYNIMLSEQNLAKDKSREIIIYSGEDGEM